MARKFDVIGEYDRNISLSKILEIWEKQRYKFTQHIREERNSRYDIAIDCLDENDEIIKKFVVDTGAKEGEEIHCVTNSGFVFIFNKDKFEFVPYDGLVTILIARYNQLLRYGCEFSDYTKQKTIEHEKRGLNRA